MGLSLSVLVALVLLLPGAAFVFAATRLHSATAPSTGLEQQLSLSLAVALVAAIVGHLMLLAALQVTSAIWPRVHLPDLHAVVQLLGGNASAAATATSQALSEHPFCVGSYILATTGLMWGVGRYANRYIQAREHVDWYHLLRPAEVSFVVLTAQFALNGDTVLFKGVLLEFRTSRTGELERVVLGVAARRTISHSKDPRGDLDENSIMLGHCWVEVPGEVMVLQMKEAKTVDLDYFWTTPVSPVIADTSSEVGATLASNVANP